ncbi:Asp/Glu racemase [Sulfitobacter sp. F26169L]|uniref:maleate cis-trans isomerase family protein n=1 Tax=Sulfitobacter sp. F26169L TaxID=2996015 RepID=UPI00226092FF|nr:Asp/Glu racemase [Sulfitobacter sp. F26169L]MCX7564755.1 Asp/Glu racemase [Sulfitobacter sp. F26169L]
MTRYGYSPAPDGPAPLGLVVLQVDETIEGDLRRMLPVDVALYITRVPSSADVTPENLKAMTHHLTDAARLLPQTRCFDVVGYGCTSATAQIGAAQVATLIKAGVDAARVSDPLTALRAACGAMGVGELALLSPYTADVSERLQAALSQSGIGTPVFGSFEEANEANVARISPRALVDAACDLAGQGRVGAIFLSCTNLRTLDVIETIEARTGLPCLSSNQVLAWHMSAQARVPGQLGSLSAS